MNARVWLLTAFLLPISAAGIPGAAPPVGPDRPLTREERQDLERAVVRLAEQREKQVEAGSSREVKVTQRQMIRLTVRIEGETSDLLATLLTMAADWAHEQGEGEEAVYHAQCLLAVRSRLHDEADWRVVDARWRVRTFRHWLELDEADQEKRGRSRRLADEAARRYQQGKFAAAVTAGRQALVLSAEAPGKKSLLHANNLTALGLIYKTMGEHARALPLTQEAVALQKELLGERHPAYATAVNNLGTLYRAMGQPGKARPLLERALALRRELLGERHQDYAASLNNLAHFLHERGEFTRARLLFEQALVIHRELYGEEHPNYALSLSNLANHLREMGEYGRARALAEQALKVRTDARGEAHPDTLQVLIVLALLDQQTGEFAAARRRYERVLALVRKGVGERHPLTLQTLNNFAALYVEMGDYARARPLLEEVVRILRDAVGEKHPYYATCLNNLGVLYQDMGEFARARTLLEQGAAIFREAFEENHPLYAQALANLSTFHSRVGNQELAQALAEKALRIRKATLGEKHPLYAESLNSRAALALEAGEHKRARLLFEQALRLSEEVLGPDHPSRIVYLHNLATLHRQSGEPARARALVEQALKLSKNLLGETHPHRARLLHQQATLEWREGKLRPACAASGDAVGVYQRHLDDTFSALGERQRLQLLQQTRDVLNVYLSVSDAAGASAAEVYERVLAWKGMVTDRQAEEHLLRDDPDLAPLLEELRLKRASLARLASQPPTSATRKEWRQRFADLENSKDDLEAQLARKSSAFRALRRLDGNSVRAALPEGTALVDLLEYVHGTLDPGQKGGWRLETRVAAFVLVKGREVVRIDLGAVAPIGKSLQAWRTALTAGKGGEAKDGQELRRLLWDRLAPALKGCHAVLIAPDGVLCQLPWAALPGREKTYLLEEVALGQVTSARQLLQPPAGREGSGLLVLGGLDYGKGTTKSWAALAGTGLEAKQVEERFRERFPKEPLRRLTGAAVHKDEMAAALRGKGGFPPRWLHLATHGFFLPQKGLLGRPAGGSFLLSLLGGEEAAPVDNPLLRSGLVLSSANSDPEKGVLTALEVANLDLRGCELVVLSACQTGLGKAEDGEGLLGLQRAFHVAGARTVVSSLWSVSDPATSVLMEQFYGHLWSGKKMTRLEAFRAAQLFVLEHPEKVRERARELREKLRGLPEAELARRGLGEEAVAAPEVSAERPTRRSSPAWWAGFVLSGDWR